MWSNGFSFTIDLQRRSGRAVVLACLFGSVSGFLSVRFAEPGPWVASIFILIGTLSFLRVLRAEWPGSPAYVRRLSGGRHVWRLWTPRGTEQAELCRAWVAGPVAALRFRGDGGRRTVVVLRRDQQPPEWRRLLVRLHHP